MRLSKSPDVIGINSGCLAANAKRQMTNAKWQSSTREGAGKKRALYYMGWFGWFLVKKGGKTGPPKNLHIFGEQQDVNMRITMLGMAGQYRSGIMPSRSKESEMRIGLWVVMAVAGGLWVGAARAEGPADARVDARARVEAAKLQADNAKAAPVIVVTTPQAMQSDVDPALERIEVTFDRPMRDKSWSWTGGGDTYPQMTGKPFYDEKRMTCTMPVKLEPGKVYWVGINSPSHRNFVSEEGVASPWYVLLFSTRGADGKPTPLPADRVRNAKKINGAYEKAVGSVPNAKGKASTREAR